MQEALNISKESVTNTDPPVRTVGLFLNFLFKDHVLPQRCLPSSPHSIRPMFSSAQNFVQMLHFCPEYSQSCLIKLIVNLYSGVPEPFEVFRCHSSTTEEELNIFLKRASNYGRHYLVLEVNKLPYMLLEVCVL